MAAYAALVSLMHIIDEIRHHHSPPISLDQHQLQSLTQILSFLCEFLERYDSPAADSDEADPLEMRIVDAVCAAEDVIESRIVDNIQSNRSRDLKTSRFLSCFRGPKNLTDISFSAEAEQSTLHHDLKQVLEEMELIKKVAVEIRTEKVVVVSASSSSYCGKNNSAIMVSSDDVLHEIMDQLTAHRRDRRVIPIVGMGGIGKTTLAQTVYSKPLITEHFDICAWVTISQQYDAREILCELLSQATRRKKEEVSERSEDDLGSELYKYLCGKRFLMVMDDMWSIDSWNDIHSFFPNNNHDSRVLVTTRLSQLGSQLNSSYNLQMEFLDEVSSWDLFSKTVFGEQNCPHELEKIGKNIVHNCRGLPLSIVVVGGILKKMEHTPAYWELIGKNLTSAVNLENDKHCLRLLKLSYDHLPTYLKPCFLYMGVFEEDVAIRVSTLVNLWVSEGFLKPMSGKSSKTDAEAFFKDLLDRNLVLVNQLGSTGSIKYFKIHDLLRDLCLNQGKKEGFCHVVGECSPRGMIGQRRIVVPRNTSKKKVVIDLASMSHARSVICEYAKVPRFRDFGLLRTLHAYKLRSYGDESYTNALVFRHVNLRHLAVEVRSTASFFSSVNLLWNLHTLIVSCTHKSSAPAHIWEMLQLRHIEFVEKSLLLPDPPGNAAILENLHTLKGVENFKCGEEVVKRIPNIKKLGIKYQGRDHHYCLDNIEYLCELESLNVSCDDKFKGIASLRKLTLPQSLKKLSLEMNGVELDLEEILEKIGWLPLLEKLKLWGGRFRGGKWEVVEGQFPSLKYLTLTKCRGLERWSAEESSVFFPRLEQLFVGDVKELKEMPSEIGNVPTLQRIELMWCTESLVMSVKEIVDEQVDLQGDQLPFHVLVHLWGKNQALEALTGPNFRVEGGPFV